MQSSPEQPVPVRTVARAIGEWVGRLGRVWVEGQITELTRRTGQARVFITLRDPVAEVSLQLSCSRAVLDAVQPPPGEGAHVVVQAKPEFYLNRGTLSLQVFEIRPVGAGALLARLEQLKQVLRAEGLFRAERKRPLPFLPRTVGLVTGRASAAERDVVDNARRRWPAVRFRTLNVPVQGPTAVPEILSALRSLDADPEVDVIVLARGGGSVEDLLPFSDEGLCRAVAGCRTPVVSAVGHESDTPIVDFVADRRASTPTDAAKLLVPDVREERARLADARARVARTVTARVARESQQAADARSRVRRCMRAMLATHAEQASSARGRARRCAAAAVQTAERDLVEQRARVRALSPAATLERGYAVLRTETGAVVRDPGEVRAGQPLTARLARGDLPVTAEPDRPRTR